MGPISASAILNGGRNVTFYHHNNKVYVLMRDSDGVVRESVYIADTTEKGNGKEEAT